MKTWQLLKKNPDQFGRYYVKEYIIKAARKFFEEDKAGHGEYHELESPIISPALPQERYLDVLSTNIGLANGEVKKAYLIPSTETFNKKILVAGLGNHFVITKVFRGLEDIGPNHSPEFTMMEWYDLGCNYLDLMRDCELLLNYIKSYLDDKFSREHSPILEFRGQKIDLTSPWPRFSVSELLEKHSGVKLEDIQTFDKIKQVAEKKGYNVDESDDWESVFEAIFLNEVEPKLPTDKPVFVYDYPKIMCPLTKQSETNPLVCEKVELYIAGREIANGYTELLDGEEQERRFKIEQEARAKLGKDPIEFDHDLVEALKAGMPPVAGIGIGIDRLAMIFANANSIAEINYFPATEMFE